MEVRLDGQTALVTGAGRNLGRAIALALAQAGARVVVNARTNRLEAEAVVQEIRRAGGEAVAALADVSDVAAVEGMVQHALKQFGSVDILVNNAAVRPMEAAVSMRPEEWDRVLRINLSGPFYCARSVIPSMVERRYGRIINISGASGISGSANQAHVVASKAGLIGLTKALAREFGHSGIAVNAVVPGAFDTIHEPGHTNWPPPQEWLNRLAVPRLGFPDEIGEICLFLASKGAAFITGQAIHINGGLIM